VVIAGTKSPNWRSNTPATVKAIRMAPGPWSPFTAVIKHRMGVKPRFAGVVETQPDRLLPPPRMPGPPRFKMGRVNVMILCSTNPGAISFWLPDSSYPAATRAGDTALEQYG